MADIYKIGVSLAMTSNAPAFFAGLSRQLLGVHAQVGQLAGGLSQLSRMKLAIGGGLSIVGGVAAIQTITKLVEKGAELQRMQNNMRLGGMTEVEVAQSTAKAWEMTAKYRSLGVTRIGDMINEVRTVFGDTKSAMANIEPALKAAVVLQSTMKGKGGSEKIVGQVFDMFKTADLRNVTDSPEDTEKFFQRMTKVVNVTGGKVTPHEFLQMQKYAKGAGQGWTDQFITGPVASMMQEQSASTVGQSLMSMHQSVAGGKMTKGSFDAFSKLGLINPDAVIYNTKGNAKNVKAGGVIGTDLFKDNPYEWVQKILLPAIRSDLSKKGKSGLSDEDFNKEASTYFSAMFGNRNAENVAMTMSKARPIERDIELGRTAMGTEGADLLQSKDWYTAVAGFTTQWDNLMKALGAPSVGAATDILNNFTSEITRVVNWAVLKENAETVQSVLKGLAVAGVALTAAGAAALLAAIGPAGWLAAGITALIALDFKSAQTQFDMARRDFEMLSDFVKWAGAKVGEMSTALAPYLSLLGLGAKKDENPGMSESAREAIAARKGEGDPLGRLATKLLEGFKVLDGVFLDIEGRAGRWFTDLAGKVRTGAEDMAKEIGTWPSRLATAISEMGAGLVTAIGDALRGLFAKFNPFSKASFGDEGTTAGLIHKASFTTDGGANDNFGGASGVSRAVGGAGGGPATVGAGSDYVASIGGKTYRSAYRTGGRERVGSWLDFYQRPVGEGGLGLSLDKARAMVAMTQGESGINLNPGSVGDFGTSIGTAQWRLGRANALKALASRMGKHWTDVGVQQQHMRNEMLGAYRGVYDRIQRAPNGEAALAEGINNFERPKYAQKAYNFRLPYLQGLRRGSAGAAPAAPATAPPTAGPPPKRPEQPGITHVHLDSKVIARAVTTRIASDSRYPNKSGGMDTHGGWRDPGTPVTDAA